MNKGFNYDFSGVKIHTGSIASSIAKSLDALAFAAGNNVFITDSHFQTGSFMERWLLAHELAHVKQRGGTAPGRTDSGQNARAEQEASRAATRVALGFTAGNLAAPVGAIAWTPTSTAVERLISYSALDWMVTANEEASAVAQLTADPNLAATVRELSSHGTLGPLLNRITTPTNRRALLRLLGSQLGAAPERSLVEPHVQALGPSAELQFNLGHYGVTTAAPAFNEAAFAGVIPSSPAAPFSGMGATGRDPRGAGVGPIDSARLLAGDKAARVEYSNPLGDLPAYLATLTPTQRRQQAQLLTQRPISTVEAESYAGQIPSRAQIMRAAASVTNLHPPMIAAIILAEQRDQSRNEDRADYTASTSLMQRDTSLGLGQVLPSTAKRNNLFSDLMSTSPRSNLNHDAISVLLVSDEYNIFATARYIRRVADMGAAMLPASLPKTVAAFPSLSLSAYQNNSLSWPEDNVAVIGMYYTSRPWTDDLRSEGWGEFVRQAYRDVIASGVF
jgi:hypothetical protein